MHCERIFDAKEKELRSLGVRSSWVVMCIDFRDYRMTRLLLLLFALPMQAQLVTWPFSVTECAGSILPPCDTLAACLEPVNSGLNGSAFAGATCYSNGAVINGAAAFSVWSATPVTVDVAWGSDDLFSLSPPTPYELDGSVTFTITGQGTIHWVAAYALPMGINEHSPRSTGSGLPFDVLGRQLKTNQSE